MPQLVKLLGGVICYLVLIFEDRLRIQHCDHFKRVASRVTIVRHLLDADETVKGLAVHRVIILGEFEQVFKRAILLLSKAQFRILLTVLLLLLPMGVFLSFLLWCHVIILEVYL